MSHARTPDTALTPVPRSEVKSTSHSQLMSRPSAYSSLMQIMVSQPSGLNEASDRRKPMGFLTSSSSTGVPFTVMTSPRPNAGVTSPAVSIMACVVACAKAIIRGETPAARRISSAAAWSMASCEPLPSVSVPVSAPSASTLSASASSNGRNIACASAATARTTASAAAALYRLYTPSSFTAVSYVSPSIAKVARWSPTARNVTSAGSASGPSCGCDVAGAAAATASAVSPALPESPIFPPCSALSCASASTVVLMSSSDGKKPRNDSSRPK